MIIKAKKDIINMSISEIEDRKISFALIFQFCMLISNYTLKHILGISNPAIRASVSLVFMLMVGVLFVKNINIVIKRIGILFISIYCGFASLFLFNMLMYKENIEYIIDSSFWFFLICLPIFLYYIAIFNKSILLNMLLKSAYYQIVLGILFTLTTNFQSAEYDMVYSYLTIVPIIILLYKVYNKFNIFDLILILFGLASIIMIGARGPIVSVALFFVLLIFINLLYSKLKLSRLLFSLVGTMILFTGIVFFKQILDKMNFILIRFGVQSRTLYLLLNYVGDFSSGRFDIYQVAIQKLMEKPILGYGLAGDRTLLNGTYPHNIFLEILVQFGLIVGTLILIIFVCYWTYGLFLNKNKEERDLGIIFCGIGLIPLFISGSYITSSNFWMFMAICIGSFHFRSNSTGT